MGELVDKVVVVTGASAGVGRATAVEFARRGARVALVARGTAGLESAVAEIEKAGGAATAFSLDVADPDAVESAAEQIETRLGPIDIWVNVAFSSLFAPFHEIDAAEFKRATEVTYLGFVYGTMAALKRMRQHNSGTIVQVGSALAYRGIPLQSAYCGAKHAIQGFNESLRCELLHDKSPIQTTMVQLPALNTPQFSWVLSRLPRQAQPVPPIYQPEVAARAIVWAAQHPERREYWVGASTALTLLVNAVAPGILDRYLGKTGYASQQTDEPRPADQPANLWEPVDRSTDFGTHGRFDDRSVSRSRQWWLTQHHRSTGVAIGALAASAAVGALALLRRASA
ncbi:SDR family oxidoreductase [Diaminobutyricibacter sp. McL0618]|uniref:SDR family oxidoreductase n=1 Tax=Leifsonia sp. McL0618 TaxID=3415677 RepID=UPI003CF1A4B7